MPTLHQKQRLADNSFFAVDRPMIFSDSVSLHCLIIESLDGIDEICCDLHDCSNPVEIIKIHYSVLADIYRALIHIIDFLHQRTFVTSSLLSYAASSF